MPSICLNRLFVAIGLLLAGASARASAPLQGDWDCSCWQDESSQTVTETTRYDEDSFRMARGFSMHGSCESPDYDFTVDAVYRLGGPSAAVPGAFEIDYEWRHAEMRPLTVASAFAFNVLAVCGRSDWATGEAKDVTGQDCDGRNPTAGGPISYQIIGISGNRYSPGDTSREGFDGTTPARRPGSLMQNIVCER